MISFFSLSLFLLLSSCFKANTQDSYKPDPVDPGKSEKSVEHIERIVESWSFTPQGWQDFAGRTLKQPYRDRALARPQDFLQQLAVLLQQARSTPYLYELVDKQHPLAATYAPKDLVKLADYPELTLGRTGLQLRCLVLPALLEMSAAAQKDGVVLTIGSSYRSFQYQKLVFQRYAEHAGSTAENRYSAKAGESQHQLGLAIDFAPIQQSFANTAAGEWLLAKAWHYGFSLSYPQGREARTGYIYEPWHYRYVGLPAAKLIREYFGNSQQEFYLFWYNSAKEWARHSTIID